MSRERRADLAEPVPPDPTPVSLVRAPAAPVDHTASVAVDALDALLAEVVPSRATGRAADLFREFARELSYRADTWRRVLAGHTASADGEYCTHRQCRRGGYGTLATPFPCSTRTVALIAQALHSAREERVSGRGGPGR